MDLGEVKSYGYIWRNFVVLSMMPNVQVGVVTGSAWFKRWYFEVEVEHIEQMTKKMPYLRVGWANTVGFIPYPGSGDQ
jgi:hypothetical protein